MWWPLRRRKKHVSAAQKLAPTLKTWQYTRIIVERGEVKEMCLKKTTWTVPLGKRIFPI
jgi:hypothetical protein